nr:hypothetical protein [Tanacetum cinerariifolium]
MFIPEDYHSIKDDIRLVSVYTTRNVIVRGMLILDEFITDDIRATEEYKECDNVFVRVDDIENIVDGDNEESYASEFVNLVFQDKDDFGNRIEPESHKEHLKTVDDDENEKEKKCHTPFWRRRSGRLSATSHHLITPSLSPPLTSPPPSPQSLLHHHRRHPLLVTTAATTTGRASKQQGYVGPVWGCDKKDDRKDDVKDDDDVNDDHISHSFDKTQETGSLESRKEKMQTPISSPHRSYRTNLSLDKTIFKELMGTVSPTPDTTSQGHLKLTSINTKDLPGSIAGMSRRHGKIMKHLKTTFVTNE